MASDPIALAILAAGVGAGAIIDLRTRRVPNTLTVTLAAAGLLSAASGIGSLGILASLAGVGLGLALMLPGHLVGATGAGDVKLLAASGAVLGPAAIATAFVYALLAGGVLALIVAAQRGRVRTTLAGTGRLVASRAANAIELEHPDANNRFAYAPAIAIGTMAAGLGW